MKNYLIAGASSGIGRGVAQALSNQNTTVILIARNKEKLENVKNELAGNAIVIPCDVTKNSDITHVFETIREKKIKLDGMIYCAGICFVKPIKAMEETDLENMFRINVFGFYEMCRQFSQNTISNKGAAIVGVSSYAAATKEMGMSAYSMTKKAMNTQVQVLSKEFLKRRIRINTVMPAVVMSKMAQAHNEWTAEELAQVKEKQPLGIIPIDDVVKAILFLMSEDASHITGECLSISSGYHG